jgi:hypothetical protein
MLPETIEREKRIANAIKYYNEYEGAELYRKVAAKFQASHGTLHNRLKDNTKGPSAKGGQNKFLTAV